jgi:hypothetical protein
MLKIMLMKRAENKSPSTWEDAIQMLRDDFEKRTDQIRQQFDKTVGKANQKVDRWNWIVSAFGQDTIDMVRGRSDVWRIATYHALLAVSGAVFVWLMMRATGQPVRWSRMHSNPVQQFC